MRTPDTIPAMRLELTFHGRVQGVGFRAVAHELANQHGATGWIRNEADGTVTLVTEGSKATLDAFLSDLRTRMAGKIDSECVTESDDIRDYAGFEIR